jgi:hypothetical protein
LRSSGRPCDTRHALFRTPWHALGLVLTLPLVLGLVALGGGDDQTFADGAMLGFFCFILLGFADVVTRLAIDGRWRRVLLLGGYAGLFMLWHVVRAGDLDVWPAAALGVAFGAFYTVLEHLGAKRRSARAPDSPDPAPQ